MSYINITEKFNIFNDDADRTFQFSVAGSVVQVETKYACRVEYDDDWIHITTQRTEIFPPESVTDYGDEFKIKMVSGTPMYYFSSTDTNYAVNGECIKVNEGLSVTPKLRVTNSGAKQGMFNKALTLVTQKRALESGCQYSNNVHTTGPNTAPVPIGRPGKL